MCFRRGIDTGTRLFSCNQIECFQRRIGFAQGCSADIQFLAELILVWKYIARRQCAIQDSALIRSKAAALAEAADNLAGFAIRNTATIGGNIMNASPAADTVPALMVLDADVVTESADGEEVIKLADFMTGPKMTALKPGAILTKIIIYPGKGNTAFVKLGRRAAETLSVVNAAAYVEKDGDACCAVRIAVGSCAPTAVLCKDAADCLVGRAIDQAAIDEAVKCIDAAIAPISDVRSSAWYRREVAPVIAGRAIAQAAGI